MSGAMAMIGMVWLATMIGTSERSSEPDVDQQDRQPEPEQRAEGEPDRRVAQREERRTEQARERELWPSHSVAELPR